MNQQPTVDINSFLLDGVPGYKYIPLVVERLKTLHPDKIILFGSYAYGTPHDDSDIDLIVVTHDDFMPANYQEKTTVYLRVSHVLDEIKKAFPIDLIVYTAPMYRKFVELGSLFSKEILQQGIVLYENDNPGMA
jgi:predicted nucleotidyltransferase